MDAPKIGLQRTSMVENRNIVAKARTGDVLRRAGALGDITNVVSQADILAKKLNISLGKTVNGSSNDLGCAESQKPTSVRDVESFFDGFSSRENFKAYEEECLTEDLVSDIDDYDRDDPQSVVAYVEEIYANCRIKEVQHCVRKSYLSQQQEVDQRVRAILVDWMIDVHMQFRLLPETLYLAVHLVDKFLSTNGITRDKLQLVAITCMFLASKYEEVHPPECQDFVFISAASYARENILDMEKVVLNAVGFQLTIPSSLHFLRRFSKAASSDYLCHTLCKYFIELALLYMNTVLLLPSQIAAASVYLARSIMLDTSQIWSPTLKHFTKYSSEDVVVWARELLSVLKENVESRDCDRPQFLSAVNRKYSSPKYSEVAKIPFPKSI